MEEGRREGKKVEEGKEVEREKARRGGREKARRGRNYFLFTWCHSD